MTTDTPDRYTPLENATPADIAACAILNEAVRQTEKNMLLYGQAERPTDMSEA
jgi:hypothetical protein